MGDVSIIARRLEDGHVQYGWSGNGGYFSSVGLRLLLWYQKPEDVKDEGRLSVMKLYDNYRKIFNYFDDWILIITDDEDKKIKDIVVKKKEEVHVETCEW